MGFDGKLVLAGRHPDKGEALAREIDAELRELDTGDLSSARAAVTDSDVVLAVLKDPQDHLLSAATQSGAAMVAITHSADTVAAPLFRYAHAGGVSDYVTAGHWQAGMAVHVARHLAAEFRSVDTIAIAALFDPADAAGPMAREDTGEYMSRALLRRGGRFDWVEAAGQMRTVEGEDGTTFQAIPMGVLDTMSLAAAIDASDIRVDIGIGPTRGSRVGQGPSHDIYFELSGTDASGRKRTHKSMISARSGQAHFTAIGIAAIAEALLERRRSGKAAGWQLPEMLVSPDRAMALAERLAGVEIMQGSEQLVTAG
jgi:hypothetical protein